jgi:hemerythrin-like domain-containing protein
VTATTALRSEHDHILAMIACLRAACAAARQEGRFDGETFESGLDFIRGYADAWHHAKEETHLFPALIDAGMPDEGGPIGVMLHEHVVGRSYVSQIAAHLAAAIEGDEASRALVLENTLAYADLLTAHIQKENGVLFNLADRILPPEEHARLERDYRAAIPEGASAATGPHFERLVMALCRQWSIDPREAAAIGASFRCG